MPGFSNFSFGALGLFLAIGLGAYLLFRVILSISLRFLRRMAQQPESITALVPPLHLMIICLALALAVGNTFGTDWVLLHELTKALLFVSLVWVAIRTVSTFIYAVYIEDSPFRSGVPALIRNAISAILYGLGLFGILHFYFGFDITGILIALGALAFVGSMAFQDTLRSFFAGISLNLDDTYHVGDLVKVADFVGEVVDTSFRTTTLRSSYNDYVTIPNRNILEAPIINFHQPEKRHRGVLLIPVTLDAPPNEVREILRSCASMAEGVLPAPAPEVLVEDMTPGHLHYAIHFSVEDYRENERVEDRIRTLVWYRLRREGLQGTGPEPATAGEGEESSSRDLLARLKEVPLLATLAPKDLRRLASLAKVERFGRGEYLFYKGDEGDSFYVVRDGEIDILMDLPDEKGALRRRTIASIAAGGFFGERSLLTGEARSAHAVAARDSQLIVIDKAAFQTILSADPTIAERLTEYLTQTLQRDRAREAAQPKSDAEAASPDSERENLLVKIRAFFDL